MNELEQILMTYLRDPVLGRVSMILVIAIILFILRNVFNKIIQRKFTETNTRYRAKKGVSFLLFMAFALACSVVFSDKLQGLTVAFGVAGAGIAFALQEVITSVAGWVAINLGGFFKIGDRVQLGGIKGDVIDIGVLRTTIMEIGGWVEGDLYNGRVVRVANSFVFKDPVFNYSGDFPFLWDELKYTITYDSNIETAMKITNEIAANHLASFEKGAKDEWKSLVKKFAIENAKIENFTSLSCDAVGVHITLRYVTDYKLRRATKSALYQDILSKINNESSVSFIYSTLEITNLPKHMSLS